MDAVTINDKQYYTMQQFAVLTDISLQSVYNYINKGNGIRKLKADRHFSKWFIPVDEVDNYQIPKPVQEENSESISDPNASWKH